jgi:hypothetical protein
MTSEVEVIELWSSSDDESSDHTKEVPPEAPSERVLPTRAGRPIPGELALSALEARCSRWLQCNLIHSAVALSLIAYPLEIVQQSVHVIMVGMHASTWRTAKALPKAFTSAFID